MDKFDLSGKVALVTGGASGIGKASALAMAGKGADMAIIDMNEEAGKAVVEEILALGRKAKFYKCNLSIYQEIADTMKTIVDDFGKLDIAFNNAGIGRPGGIPTMREEALGIWDDIMAINLDSVFHCCREEGRYIIPQGGGCIINTASMSGSSVNHFPDSHFGISTIAYCTAKAGVVQLTKALAVEWAKYNIRVNSISPGYVKTPFTAKLSDPQFSHVLDMQHMTVPMGRRAEAEEITGGVLYLASDAASYTTGHDLLMDGGYSVW